MGITFATQGQRVYVRGDTYPLREVLRGLGAKWDPEVRAWWVGRTRADALAQALEEAGRQNSHGSALGSAPGEDAVVAGRAEYRGRPCYLAGRVIRGRTRWDDEVATVETRDGGRVLLYSVDGARQWWGGREEVRVVKAYQRPQTIGGLRRFAERVRENGGIHPNACPHCGQLDCSAAYGRGGLCDED